MIARRSFLAGLGLAACTRAPKEEIVPYVNRPPEITPGTPRFYASALTLDGYATGIIAECHEGRPTKIEGNPDHPASLGATSVFEQAAIYSLYDAKRPRTDEANWEKAKSRLRNAKHIHFRLAPTSSPAVAGLLAELGERVSVEFFGAGRVIEPRYDLTRADVIVALDADFLGQGPQRLRLARQFATRRATEPMNRLYAIGPLLTVTSAQADHRFPIRASEVFEFARSGLPKAIQRDLARGPSLVIAGERQPPEVHALARAMNAELGNIGTTVAFAPSVLLRGRGTPAGADLVVTQRRGLFVIEGIMIAEAHELESWGDARAFDGTTSIIQPMIEPLTGGKTLLDLLAVALGHEKSAHDLVRARFDDRAWRRALKRGVTDDAPIEVVSPDVVRPLETPAAVTTGIELVIDLDARMHDGRFDGNAWLAELPQPITTLTWMNAATIAPATAQARGINDGDELALGDLRAPALIVPGQAENVIGLTMGWGRELARGIRSVVVTKTGRTVALPLTQLHHRLEGRDEQIARHRKRGEPNPPRKKALTLYEPKQHDGHKWGMAIDLAKCIGCDACMIACQAENNVPTVGADQVLRGRVMHWLRVDTYFADDAVITQPMLCQHCEKAPCEYVCPVGATAHSPEGINEMTYNRCVGTRFCSNNCPYKVRRFNWFDYHLPESKTEMLAHNPDVTVRARGVMEKCTFCVQRLHEKNENPVTACQQACPAGAIVFGDLARRDAEVARLHDDPRSFAALEDLGTEPRVRYLAKVRNPNPELP